MTNPATVNLTKASPTVSQDKQGATSGMIKVNLNWTSPQAAPRRVLAAPVRVHDHATHVATAGGRGQLSDATTSSASCRSPIA
ncbi:hypothetical protein ABZ611_30050 [Streptomyces sp. NPDC007861]|uniref:hypothetical protein n=1 Tax=Streptomyces sp. NPDC007861 TaxID=3154893 RepID=UPI0033F6E692